MSHPQERGETFFPKVCWVERIWEMHAGFSVLEKNVSAFCLMLAVSFGKQVTATESDIR